MKSLNYDYLFQNILLFIEIIYEKIFWLLVIIIFFKIKKQILFFKEVKNK